MRIGAVLVILSSLAASAPAVEPEGGVRCAVHSPQRDAARTDPQRPAADAGPGKAADEKPPLLSLPLMHPRWHSFLPGMFR